MFLLNETAALLLLVVCALFSLEERIDNYLRGYEDGVHVNRPRPGWAPRTLISATCGVGLVLLLARFGVVPPLWVGLVVLGASFVWWVALMFAHRRDLRKLRKRCADAAARRASSGAPLRAALFLAAAIAAGAGCDEAACIRQSDCPAPLVCNAELVCVAPPTDDAGADGGDAGGAVVVGDLGPGLCTVALRCEVFAAWGERAKQCEGALAPDQVAKVHNELACVLAGCPIDCATQLNNVELRDPAACWGCASQKLGNLCVVECP